MPFVSLKHVLESVLKECNLTPDIDAYEVFSAWAEIAGPVVASHSRPVRMNGATLYIEVDDPIWLSQLRYMKQDILRKISTRTKPGLFNDIKLFIK